MYRIVERRQNNGNQDEVALGGRTEEGKKLAHPAKS
jgi:hypothetical protein